MWTTVEIKLSLENGYKIIDICEIWDWENRKSNQLFRKYMMKWMKLKWNSSPEEGNMMEYVDMLNEEYGLNLKLEDISANPAMRSLG